MADTHGTHHTATAPAPEPTTAPDEVAKTPRQKREVLSSQPLGLYLPSAPPVGEHEGLSGVVSLGWLRMLVRSIPRAVGDEASVSFDDERTAVGRQS